MYGWVVELIGNGVAAITLVVFGGPIAILPFAVLAYLLFPAVRGYYTRDY